MEVNPILLQVFKNLFASVAEEMGVTLNRTAFSANIKERRDYSCAVFTGNGQLVAQAAHIPVHLGSMPMSVKTALERFDFQAGDMVILNDPFQGGTHLPDITIVAPVFAGEEKPVFYVANRAHHADIGGMSAGSMPLATTIYQEGLIIPPLKIMQQGEPDRQLIQLILSNVRTPDEREGDLAAQLMANTTGIRRLQELTGKYGSSVCEYYAARLMDYSEAITRAAISALPDGSYEFSDFLDGDGVGTDDIPIRLTVKVSGDSIGFDFRKSGDQVKGSVNAVYAITVSTVLYVMRCLVARDIPMNAGILRPVEVITRPGSVLDARFPAAVAGGNVETSQRIVDVILGALARALPGKIPAASQGTMNNVTLGGFDHEQGRAFAYYETIAGGCGASAQNIGAGAVHSHMTNTLNTPVEALEYSYPLLVTKYAVRRGSGGQGANRGGDGIIREIKMLAETELNILSERRKYRPYGLEGGEAGQAGRNIIIKNGQQQFRPGKFSELLQKGDILKIETPGGGGYGSVSQNEL
ncbi:MAG TPA: hydantoinase B/oxoprolinase family protein [Desulfitobacteriaceae bacterium]|jgi:N-methylhydantoinase B|nr:hydantoinase B/oxoprolinase family protein [Desulfitobacteriaceae bacterium]